MRKAAAEDLPAHQRKSPHEAHRDHLNVSKTKLSIDECLSAELALMARERGHYEASHVVWIGKSSWKDWELN